jgi:hypothetical protein
VYQKLRTWIGEFPVILRKSKQEATDLPDDLVWQDNFVPYWHELDAWSRALLDIDDQIEAFVYEPAKPISGKVRELYYSVSKAIKFVPNKARIEFAFDEPKFEFSEKLQRKHIAYEISRLSTWADAFESWVAESEKTLLSAIKKVQSIGWKRKTAHSEQAERVVERFASSKIQVCKLRSSGEYEIHSPDCSAASTRGRKYSECELIPGTNAIDAAAYIYSDHIKNREGTAEEYADYFKTHNCLR